MNASSHPPIDLTYLRRFTLGNHALETEVLDLFAGQAPSTLDSLKAAAEAKAWRNAAHTLKGSARAVGAELVANWAEAAERQNVDSVDRLETLQQLETALATTIAFIESRKALA